MPGTQNSRFQLNFGMDEMVDATAAQVQIGVHIFEPGPCSKDSL